MKDAQLQAVFKAKLTDKEFEKLSIFIDKQVGIKMPIVKKIMLQSRLQRRLRALNLSDFKTYLEYLFSEEGQKHELIHMLDVVSTNKTDFFREPVHFDFLSQIVLPAYIEEFPSNRTMKLWSAGCSSGEEPYTIAITLNEFQKQFPGFKYHIHGTDISSRILQQAVNAVYKEERIINIPIELKRKYFLRSKDRQSPTVRVVSDLRKMVSYSRLNFMDNTYELPDFYDLIFCRNVLIYFNRETQEKVIQRLCTKLRSGGYLFIGHSESIMGLDVPLKQIKPTIFQRL